MRISPADTFDRLVQLTAPGAPVAPVVAALADAAGEVVALRPALEQAHASAYLLGEMDRITGAARTLHDSLAELAATDGMTTFDPAFASDDASWDAWFVASADLVRTAEQVLGGAAQPTTSTVSV